MSTPVQPVAALDNAGILSQSANADVGSDKITIVSRAQPYFRNAELMGSYWAMSLISPRAPFRCGRKTTLLATHYGG